MRAALLFVLICLSSQIHAASYYVSVNALAAPGAEAKKQYVLISEDETLDTSSLQHQEYLRQLKHALSMAGFIEAGTAEQAEVALFYSYGIGEPVQTTRAYAIPIRGQTGVSSSHTTGTVNTFGNTAMISATTTHTPTYGVTGVQSGVVTDTTYTRHLRVTGVDYRHYVETNEARELWTLTAVSSGWSDDLRLIFPVMLSASYKHFGRRTERALDLTIRDRNRDLKTLRAGAE